MHRTFTVTTALISAGFLYACSTANPQDADDDDSSSGRGGSTSTGGGSGTGTGGTGTGGTGTGGTSATGGAGGTTATGGGPATGGGAGLNASGGTGGTVGGTGGTGVSGSAGMSMAGMSGTGPVTCTNSDKTILPIDASGWVAKECNDRQIQGPWYCYSDGIAPTDCVKDVVPYKAGMGMCSIGSTVVDPDYKAWGAGVALGLSETGKMGDTASVKTAYNATANGVLGFHIDIAGDTAGLPLRVQFTNSATPNGAMPFVEVPGPKADGYDIMIADALVPMDWEGEPNAGLAADPANLFDMQVQVVGATTAANYDFCITGVKPITDGSMPMTGTVANYGSSVCGANDEIKLGNSYTIRNNVYNANGQQQCVQALWDNGSKAGFIINPVGLTVAGGGAPGSYPSIVTGWHYGKWYGAYGSAKQLSGVTGVPTNWAFTVPANGAYDVSYDVWMNDSNANPSTPSGGLELMVWLNKRDATPIGTVGPTVTIGGQSWVVWYGPNAGGWNTVSYVAATNATSYTGDLKPFFDDSVTRGYIHSTGYLLGVQAGFEIWQQNQSMTTNTYNVAIN